MSETLMYASIHNRNQCKHLAGLFFLHFILREYNFSAVQYAYNKKIDKNAI